MKRAFDICEWNITHGICAGKRCENCVKEVTITDNCAPEQTPVRKKRKYDFGAKHRVTSVLGIYRVFVARGCPKNFGLLMEDYKVPKSSIKKMIAYAEGTRLFHKHMTIAETIVRDYNKGSTRFA